MKRLACFVCAGIIGAMTCAVNRAEAQDNYQAVSAAKTLFEQGQKQMEEKNYDSACASFKASNEAVARVGTLLNLADCYEKGGKLASAWGAYFEAINLGRRQNKPEYEEFAQKKREELEPKLLKMSIVVPADVKVEGLKVTRDGLPVEPAVLGVPIAVDPGKHSIDATAPRKLAFHTEITVDDSHKLVEVKIEKLADAPVAWPQSNQPQVVERLVQVPSAWTGIRVAGIVAGSAGIVAIALGSALGLVANDKYQSALKQQCNNDPNACSPAGVTNGAGAHDLANVATGLFVGGLVAVAAGVTLFVIGAPAKPNTLDNQQQSAMRLRITPLPGGAGASLAGAF